MISARGPIYPFIHLGVSFDTSIARDDPFLKGGRLAVLKDLVWNSTLCQRGAQVLGDVIPAICFMGLGDQDQFKLSAVI